MKKSTITLILDLLKMDNFYNCSDTIDIAKGRFAVPMNFKEMKNTIKRNKEYN